MTNLFQELLIDNIDKTKNVEDFWIDMGYGIRMTNIHGTLYLLTDIGS